MFHRKVHPEYSTVAQKYDKHQKNEKKKMMNEGENNKSVDAVHPEEDINIMLHPTRAVASAKESMRQYKIRQPNPVQLTVGSEDSCENDNREHWIKTDADCKYPYSCALQIVRYL